MPVTHETTQLLPTKPKKLRFRYTNHKLETEQRRVEVIRVWWGASEYHTGEQWFLQAMCSDRHEVRNFAMRDMTEVSEV